MEKQEYPKWIYKGQESKIVRDAEEHAQYGDWKESPGEVEEAVAESKKEKKAAKAKKESSDQKDA